MGMVNCFHYWLLPINAVGCYCAIELRQCSNRQNQNHHQPEECVFLSVATARQHQEEKNKNMVLITLVTWLRHVCVIHTTAKFQQK